MMAHQCCHLVTQFTHITTCHTCHISCLTHVRNVTGQKDFNPFAEVGPKRYRYKFIASVTVAAYIFYLSNIIHVMPVNMINVTCWKRIRSYTRTFDLDIGQQGGAVPGPYVMFSMIIRSV